MAFLSRRAAPSKIEPKATVTLAAGAAGDARNVTWRAALRMYRTDHVFRGLVDVSVAGALILAFSGSFSLPWPAMGHLTGMIKQSVSPLVRSVTPDRETMAPGRVAGGMSHDTLAADPTLRDGGLVDDAAKEAQAAMDRGDYAMALGIVGSWTPKSAISALMALYQPIASAVTRGDKDEARRLTLKGFAEADPRTNTARAIIFLNEDDLDHILDALGLLRLAAEHGYAPAFSLIGRAEFKLLDVVEHHGLPAEALQTVDALGTARQVTPDQLRSEALQWFERGAAFGEAVSIRALGMAQADGWTGKPNIQAAIAHFRDAAARGDGPAAVELGLLYQLGAGVAVDQAEAERLYREGVAGHFGTANVFLAELLMNKAKGADVAIATEALSFFKAAVTTSASVELRGMAERAVGYFFLEGAPPQLRDLTQAVDHFSKAFTLGDDRAAIDLSRLYRLGLGVEINVRKARAYALIASEAGYPREAAALETSSWAAAPSVMEQASIRRLAHGILYTRNNDPAAVLRQLKVKIAAPNFSERRLPSLKPIAKDLR